MHESRVRMLLVIGAGSTVAGFISWSLDKVFAKSIVRDAILSGACIYIALTIDSVLLK